MLTFFLTGADPTVENEGGHQAKAYAKSKDISDLLQDGVKKVFPHTFSFAKVNRNRIWYIS